MVADELTVEREKAEKFQNLFQEGQSQTRALEDEVKSLSERLQATCVELEQERNVLQLERYRAVESEREKWEAREQKITDELEKVREELLRCKGEYEC